MRSFIIIFCFIFLAKINNSIASTKNNIIQNLNEIANLSFKFKQNIDEKTEEGNCIIEYPKKIYCEYYNKKKILVSDGKNLVIQNLNSNQFYIYPIKKTAFNLILDKNFLID